MARSTVGITILVGKGIFEMLTASIEAQFKGHPDALLFTVMVAIPLLLNIGLAWIQDAVLKWKSTRRPGRRTVTSSGAGLLGGEGGEGEGGAMVGLGAATTGGEQVAIGAAQQLASQFADLRVRASDKASSTTVMVSGLHDDS